MDNKEQTSNEGEQAFRDLKDTMKGGGADVAEDARAAAGDVRGVVSETVETVRDTAARLAKHVRAATASAKVAAADGAESVGHAAHKVATRQRDTILYWQLCAEDYIQRQPIRALAAAAGAGVLLGLWLRGRRR